jgi:hypothetical protein
MTSPPTIVCATAVTEGSYFIYTIQFQETYPQKIHVGHYPFPCQKHTGPIRCIKDTSLLQCWPLLGIHNREQIIIQLLQESGEKYPYYGDGYYIVNHTYLCLGSVRIPIIEWSSNSEHLPYQYNIACHPSKKEYIATTEKYVVRVFEPKPIEITTVDGRSRVPELVYRGMMEGALYRKETCPVSFEELTEENICITPCFHTFDRATVLRLAYAAGSLIRCPVCRTEYARKEIVYYK